MNETGQNINWTERFDNWLEIVKTEFENALSDRLGKKVNIETESSRSFDSEEIPEIYTGETLVIECPFDVESLGAWRFLMERSFSASLMEMAAAGSAEGVFDPEGHTGVLSDLWKAIMDVAAGSLGVMMGLKINAAMPEIALDSSELSGEIDIYTGALWNLQIEGSDGGTVIMFVPFDFSMVFEVVEQEVAMPETITQEIEPEVQQRTPAQPKPSKGAQPLVRPVEFEDLSPTDVGKQSGTPRNIDMLLDVSLPITIELGRTKMLIKDVLALGAGSVIELDKLSGEPVDMYVNDKLFAKGEVVVIEENFGVRITELIKLDERMKALQ